MEEVWKDIPGYEGLYQASNMGNVKVLERSWIAGNGSKHHRESQPVKKVLVKDYHCVTLRKNNKAKLRSVQRIIWETFNGPIPPGMQCNHVNEIKTDNRLENLNLMTPKENSNWGTRNKRLSDIHRNRQDCSKPVLQYTPSGEFVAEYPSAGEAGRQTKINPNNIRTAARNAVVKNHGRLITITKAGGFIWKYKNQAS